MVKTGASVVPQNMRWGLDFLVKISYNIKYNYIGGISWKKLNLRRNFPRIFKAIL